MSARIESLDQSVRWHVYDMTMRSGSPPHSREVAAVTGVAATAILESFRRLGDAHILVLQGDGEILMANPFSAVPTPFHVRIGALSAYGNCIWDALGIAAMLHEDARISASCADCGSATEITVADGKVEGEGLIHFAVPAREWWKDIVFT